MEAKAAFEALSDSGQRAEYDRRLRAVGGARSLWPLLARPAGRGARCPVGAPRPINGRHTHAGARPCAGG
jgi:hypothetical protein